MQGKEKPENLSSQLGELGLNTEDSSDEMMNEEPEEGGATCECGGACGGTDSAEDEPATGGDDQAEDGGTGDRRCPAFWRRAYRAGFPGQWGGPPPFWRMMMINKIRAMKREQKKADKDGKGCKDKCGGKSKRCPWPFFKIMMKHGGPHGCMGHHDMGPFGMGHYGMAHQGMGPFVMVHQGIGPFGMAHQGMGPFGGVGPLCTGPFNHGMLGPYGHMGHHGVGYFSGGMGPFGCGMGPGNRRGPWWLRRKWLRMIRKANGKRGACPPWAVSSDSESDTEETQNEPMKDDTEMKKDDAAAAETNEKTKNNDTEDSDSGEESDGQFLPPFLTHGGNGGCHPWMRGNGGCPPWMRGDGGCPPWMRQSGGCPPWMRQSGGCPPWARGWRRHGGKAGKCRKSFKSGGEERPFRQMRKMKRQMWKKMMEEQKKEQQSQPSTSKEQ